MKDERILWGSLTVILGILAIVITLIIVNWSPEYVWVFESPIWGLIVAFLVILGVLVIMLVVRLIMIKTPEIMDTFKHITFVIMSFAVGFTFYTLILAIISHLVIHNTMIPKVYHFGFNVCRTSTTCFIIGLGIVITCGILALLKRPDYLVEIDDNKIAEE